MKAITTLLLLSIASLGATAQNLISNDSFDELLQLNCEDWYDGCGQELTANCDTTTSCLVSFEKESPSPIPEDQWSIQLHGGFAQPGFAETYITGQSGIKTYQLTCRMKSNSNIDIGYVSLGLGTQEQFTASKTISDTAADWKQLTLTDTLTTDASDTITVRLAAEICDFCVKSVYFDLIKLMATDSTPTAISSPETEVKLLQVHPVPARDIVTFEFSSMEKSQKQISIYNLSGRRVKTIESYSNVVSINSNKLPPGSYFYQITSIPSGRQIDRGKLFIQ